MSTSLMRCPPTPMMPQQPPLWRDDELSPRLSETHSEESDCDTKQAGFQLPISFSPAKLFALTKTTLRNSRCNPVGLAADSNDSGGTGITYDGCPTAESQSRPNPVLRSPHCRPCPGSFLAPQSEREQPRIKAKINAKLKANDNDNNNNNDNDNDNCNAKGKDKGKAKDKKWTTLLSPKAKRVQKLLSAVQLKSGQEAPVASVKPLRVVMTTRYL